MSSFSDDSQYGAEPGDHGSASDPGQAGPRSAAARPPLRRPAKGRMVAGVAAAIGRYFNVDVTIVRVVFAVLTIAGFTGLPFLGGIPLYLGGVPLYLACWLLIPEQGSDHSIAASFLRDRQHKSG